MRTNTKKLTTMSMFVAIALALNIVEKMLPLPTMVVGVKLGLANIVTIVGLAIFGLKDALLILISRIILGSIFGGGASGFLYSFLGGIFSILSMAILVRLANDRVSLVGVSVTGAFFHSLGQIIMAVILFQNIRLLGYLPIMLITSIATGIFIGLVGEKLKPYLFKI